MGPKLTTEERLDAAIAAYEHAQAKVEEAHAALDASGWKGAGTTTEAQRRLVDAAASAIDARGVCARAVVEAEILNLGADGLARHVIESRANFRRLLGSSQQPAMRSAE